MMVMEFFFFITMKMEEHFIVNQTNLRETEGLIWWLRQFQVCNTHTQEKDAGWSD